MTIVFHDFEATKLKEFMCGFCDKRMDTTKGYWECQTKIWQKHHGVLNAANQFVKVKKRKL